jgi:DNA ligase (NAD+)
MVIEINVPDLSNLLEKDRRIIADVLLQGDKFVIGKRVGKKRVDDSWIRYDFKNPAQEEALVAVLAKKKVRAIVKKAKPKAKPKASKAGSKPAAAAPKANKIKQLEKDIQEWNKLYYTTGTSPVSDATYDAKKAQLKKLAPDSPVLKFVGTKTGGKIKHDPPMLSADKATSVNDVIKWAGTNDIVWGFKVDGLSMKVVYTKGQLMLAATRGDGREGDNTTSQARMIADIPKTVGPTESFEVRGEVYMTKAAFEKVNSTEGGKFNSPRNLAVGTLKAKDPKLVASRGLKFMAWDVIVPGKMLSVMQKIEFLKDHGFKVADQSVIKASRLDSWFAEMIEKRDSYVFEMDGIVFKVNDPAEQLRMGSSDTFPRWMLALKWPAEEHKTTIESITWQLSRTGKLTPVAELKRVRIEGSNIDRATLNNAAFVRERDIAAGDIAFVIKAGGTIPHVVSTKKANGKHASLPATCPNCGGKTRMEGRELYCDNPECGDQVIRHISNYIEEVGIEGIGKTNARILYLANAVRHPADLYVLTADDFAKHLGSEAIGKKVHASVQAHKTLPIDVFLRALNVVQLGDHASRKIAMQASSIEAVTPELVKRLYPGVTGDAIVAGLAKKPWIPFFKAGVKLATGEVKKVEYPVTAESPIAGKKVYVTGKIPDMNKDQVEAFVTQHGGIYGNGTSPGLELLVLGTNVEKGNAKVANAEKHGIKMVTWAQFQRMFDAKPAAPSTKPTGKKIRAGRYR